MYDKILINIYTTQRYNKVLSHPVQFVNLGLLN